MYAVEITSVDKEMIADCDALIAGMEKCSDAWWGGIGDADDTDFRKLREIAYRIRARASLVAPEEKASYILLATEKGLTPVGKLVDALQAIIRQEEGAFEKAEAALDQFSVYTDNMAVSQPQRLQRETVETCRRVVLSVSEDAHEAAKAKDATDYVAGYQDAVVDCDEALRALLSEPQSNHPEGKK